MEHQLLENTRKVGDIALFIACLLEVILFYSPVNIVGCFMTIVSWVIFSRVFLHRSIILLHPFSFLAFLTMSFYRILPLFATLLEFKPISYRFEIGEQTFLLELLLYIVSCLAFALVTHRRPSNNIITQTLYSIGFYKPLNEKQFWYLGFLGLFTQIYLQFVGKIETGDAFHKLIQTFVFAKYAPFIMVFPILYNPFSKDVFKTNSKIILYIAFVILLCFTGNSRRELLEPIMLLVTLSFLAIIKSKTSYQKYISSNVPFIALIAIGLIIPQLSDISDAMLLVRGSRSEISKQELFQRTLGLYLDKEELAQQKKIYDFNQVIINKNKEGWSEDYLNNFALNRYSNIRISDLTLYHANRVGFENKHMQRDFIDRIIKLFPAPILNFFQIKADKDYIYSRGDYLYALSNQTPIFAGLRVTSHLADGLATWGYWYFIIQFILFYINFLLIDCFTYYDKKRVVYSICGLIYTYHFIGRFRNANGCFSEFGFIIRGFIQIVFIYILLHLCVKLISHKT